MKITDVISSRTTHVIFAMIASSPFFASAAMALPTQEAPAPLVNSAKDLLRDIEPLKNDLARYQYLVGQVPRLTDQSRIVGQQLVATVENQLGLYDEAVRDFPFDNRVPIGRNNLNSPGSELPRSAVWVAQNAADVITEMAQNRQLVMINEVHHDAHTRELTLELLPRLRKLGFTYFAAEALDEKDTQLMQRGYPIIDDSPYLHEPIYGEIIREAIRLGFTIVPYEAPGDTTAEREKGQAENLYNRVFAHDPHARLFVHSGYAHIDKVEGELGAGVLPMAAQLRRLSGIDPLSIDQTQLRDIGGRGRDDEYHQLMVDFHPDRPSVLVRREDRKIWTTNHYMHDVSVLLPPMGHRRRPSWLSLDGKRDTHLVSTSMCSNTLPCLIEAHYANEADNATAADRVVLTTADSANSLYLGPGDYRLTAVNAEGRRLSESKLHIDAKTP